MSTTGEQYLQAWARLADLAAGVPAADWDIPSPCADCSARQLSGHLVDGQRQVRALLTGRGPLTPVTDPGDLAQLGVDPATSLREAARQAEVTLTDIAPGTLVATPHGTLPAEQRLTVAMTEPMVHGVDLADAVERVLVVDEQGRRDGPVRNDARPIEQLLAALGRTADAASATAIDGNMGTRP